MIKLFEEYNEKGIWKISIRTKDEYIASLYKLFLFHNMSKHDFQSWSEMVWTASGEKKRMFHPLDFLFLHLDTSDYRVYTSNKDGAISQASWTWSSPDNKGMNPMEQDEYKGEIKINDNDIIHAKEYLDMLNDTNKYNL